MKLRHTPVRQCVGCRKMYSKSELLRIVKGTDGVVSFDSKKKLNGRGAYICRNPECVDMAIKNKSFARSLKIKVDDTLVTDLYMECVNVN